MSKRKGFLSGDLINNFITTNLELPRYQSCEVGFSFLVACVTLTHMILRDLLFGEVLLILDAVAVQPFIGYANELPHMSVYYVAVFPLRTRFLLS